MKTPNFYSLLLLILLVSACNTKTTSQEPIPKQIKTMTNYDDDFMSLLPTLSSKDLNSISTITQKIKSLPTDYQLSDNSYFKLKEFMDKTLDHFNQAFMDNYADVQQDLWDGKDSQRLKDLNSLLSENGLALGANEGMYYAKWKPNYFPQLFANNTSTSLKEYLKIIEKEEKEGFAIDAFLVISFEKVANRALTWEKYLNKYPTTATTAKAREHYKTNLYFLINGMDNSPIMDVFSFKLLPEIKTLYKNFPLSYPNTKTGKIIQDYYDYWKEREFKVSFEAIEIFNKKHQIELP